MPYIKLDDKTYPVTEQEIREIYSNTSFPFPFQPPQGYAPVLESTIPDHDSIYQSYRELDPVQDSHGNWIKTYEVYNLSDTECWANKKSAILKNKLEAEKLLSETDWVENPSVSDTSKIPHITNFEEIINYRLSLRRIAVDPPVKVDVWPIKPQIIWKTA